MKKLFSLPKPSAAAYAILALFWTIVGRITIFLIAEPLPEGSFHYPTILSDMLCFWPENIALSIIVGAIIGSIHYLLARAYSRKDKHALNPCEISAVVLAASIFCVYPAYNVIDFIRTVRIQHTCVQRKVYRQIASLVENGDVQQAVRIMEKSCEKYHQIDRENIAPRSARYIHWRSPSGSGYYYGTLYYGWHTLSMNLPESVHEYLNMEILHIGNLDVKWKPLGVEMAASRTPIIRILGYWLLEDRASFTEEVYQQYDSGDQTYRSLKDVACFKYDPDLKRAMQRILSFTPMQMTEKIDCGVYSFYDEKDRDHRAYELAIQILDARQTLDEPEVIRPIIERYLKSPEGRLSDKEYQSEHAEAHTQLMTLLGLPTP